MKIEVTRAGDDEPPRKKPQYATVRYPAGTVMSFSAKVSLVHHHSGEACPRQALPFHTIIEGEEITVSTAQGHRWSYMCQADRTVPNGTMLACSVAFHCPCGILSVWKVTRET